MKRSNLYLITALAIAAVHVPASATLLCKKKKSGVVVAREACKKGEAPVDLSQVGAAGPSGPQGPQGPQGVPGAGALHVLDSTGQEVGKWFPLGGLSAENQNQNTARSVGGRVLTLFVSPYSIGGENQSPQLDYTSPGCSGPAYVEISGFTQTLSTPGFDPGSIPSASKGYYAGSPVQTITLQSYAVTLRNTGATDCSNSSTGACWAEAVAGTSMSSPIPEDTSPWCCCPGTGQLDAGPLMTLDLTPFVPPFRVE